MTAAPLAQAAALVIAVAACTAPPPVATAAPTSRLDSTGILIVDLEERVQLGPVTEDLADAMSEATLLAEDAGDDVGYPWIDPVSGELVLSAATPQGRELIDSAGINVPYRIRDVAHGAAVLRRIEDDVTLLESRGVDGAELIFMTLPDHRDNRTLILMAELYRPLLDYLAATYPPDAIAVQVDPELAPEA